jgi:hypothetical protein
LDAGSRARGHRVAPGRLVRGRSLVAALALLFALAWAAGNATAATAATATGSTAAPDSTTATGSTTTPHSTTATGSTTASGSTTAPGGTTTTGNAPTEAETITHLEAQLYHATQLQEAGFSEDARKLVLAALQEVPPKPTGPLARLAHELRHLADELRTPTQRPSRWQGFLGLHGPTVIFLAEIIAIALCIVVLALLFYAAVRGLLRRLRGSVRLEGFTGSSESTLSAALAASLGDALARLKDDSPSQNLHYQSGSEPKFEVPAAVLESVPQGKLIAGLLQMLDQLLPRHMSLISGTVHPIHENRGAGLTIALADHNGRGVDQITLWEKDYFLKEAGDNEKEAVRYERLVLPAAVWLAYQPQLGFKADKPPLGASDWRSYALFALGELVPDLAKRRVMYERALDRDARNLGARLNLADLLLRRPREDMLDAAADPDDGHRETWNERLDEARRHLEYVASNAAAESAPIWYRALYMQIVLNIYDYQATLAENPTAARSWATQARTRHEELNRALRHAGGNDSTPQMLLDAMDEPLQILSYTVKLYTGRLKQEPRLQDAWLSASAEYNLACFWSRYAAYAGNADLEQKRVRTAIVHLRRSIERTDNAVIEARTDPAFDTIRSTPAFASIVPPA